MSKRLLITSFLFFIINLGFSATIVKNDTLPIARQIIDSLVFSEKLDWSFRLVSNFKQQQFRLRNDGDKLYYKPNNPYGIGFGIANQKMVIDILFNIKNEEKDFQTDKFAAEGGIVLKKNYFSFLIENVHGYNITNNINDDEVFRKDITIFSLGINYLRLIKSEHFSVRMMKSGQTDQEKTSVSFGLGGFVILNRLSSEDGSILPFEGYPYFNDKAAIKKISAYGGGVLAGLATYFVLPANFFFAVSASSGIGLEYKEISSVTEDYVPSKPFVYKLDLFAGMGYKGKRFYVHFTFGTNLYGTDLDFNNKSLLSVTKSKLAVGYNIGKINFKKKK